MHGLQFKSAAMLAAVLATTVAVQTASAGERHSRRGADQTSQRTVAPISLQIRNSNAYLRDNDGATYSDSSRYQNGAASAPAGR